MQKVQKLDERNVAGYVEDFAKSFFKQYEDMAVWELPERLGLPECGESASRAYAIADVLQKKLVERLFEDEEFLSVTIKGYVSNGADSNAFILNIHPFSVSEDMEVTDDTPELDSDFLCYCIISSGDRIYFGFSFLDVDDMSPSPFVGNPVSCIKPFLPL